jgi:hypothetical protein
MISTKEGATTMLNVTDPPVKMETRRSFSNFIQPDNIINKQSNNDGYTTNALSLVVTLY